ncbi:hypothetical protein PspMM1_36590 [Pseudoalteromonas sp. MM1]|nr:hypothetical protein PspMM1_36590 [Pseudoalteromonas sp. MM1]
MSRLSNVLSEFKKLSVDAFALESNVSGSFAWIKGDISSTCKIIKSLVNTDMQLSVNVLNIIVIKKSPNGLFLG